MAMTDSPGLSASELPKVATAGTFPVVFKTGDIGELIGADDLGLFLATVRQDDGQVPLGNLPTTWLLVRM